MEITLLFAIWDSTDGVYDTTVLVDDVRWTFATSPGTTIPPQRRRRPGRSAVQPAQ